MGIVGTLSLTRKLKGNQRTGDDVKSAFATLHLVLDGHALAYEAPLHRILDPHLGLGLDELEDRSSD